EAGGRAGDGLEGGRALVGRRRGAGAAAGGGAGLRFEHPGVRRQAAGSGRVRVGASAAGPGGAGRNLAARAAGDPGHAADGAAQRLKGDSPLFAFSRLSATYGKKGTVPFFSAGGGGWLPFFFISGGGGGGLWGGVVWVLLSPTHA